MELDVAAAKTIITIMMVIGPPLKIGPMAYPMKTSMLKSLPMST